MIGLGGLYLADDNAGLSFVEQHRLEELPAVMQRLEAELGKLVEFMSDPDMFSNEPVTFQKATDALIERQSVLDAAKEEWVAV